MRKTLIVAGIASLLSAPVMAETIGASIARFDDNWLTVMRIAMTDHAATLDGIDMQVEDATDDVGKQLNQIQNFIAAGVDAIIVNAVDTDATVAMSKAAADAGVRHNIRREKIAPDQGRGKIVIAACFIIVHVRTDNRWDGNRCWRIREL